MINVHAVAFIIPVSLKYCRKISFSVCGAENIDIEKAIERKIKINENRIKE